VLGEQGVEHVGNGAATEAAADGSVRVGVHVREHRPDAEPHRAVLVGLVGVEGVRRLLAERVVHLVEPDPCRRPGQRPAGTGAAARRDEPGVAERPEGLADERRVAGEAGGDPLRGQRRVAAAGGELQPAQGVDGGGEAGVRGHG